MRAALILAALVGVNAEAVQLTKVRAALPVSTPESRRAARAPRSLVPSPTAAAAAQENFDELKAGKGAFVKFLAPW